MLSRLKAGLIFSSLFIFPLLLSAEEVEIVRYKGINSLDTGHLASGSYLREGVEYSDSLLQIELQRIDSLYFNIGHPGTVIRAYTAIGEKGYTVDIEASERGQARFRDIKISGDYGSLEESGIFLLQEGEDFAPALIGGAMSATLDMMNRAGFPFAQVWVTGFSYNEDDNTADISFSVVTGEQMSASDIIFEGLTHTDTSTALRASGFTAGIRYDERVLGRVRKRLEGSSLFSEVGPGRVIRRGSGEVGLVFSVKEIQNRNLFRGAFGFSRKANDEYEVNGNVELQLNNIAGTGRRADFMWINDGRDYSRTEVGYLEPFLFSSSFSLETSIRQVVQDSLYNMNSGSLKLRTPFGPAGYGAGVTASADRIVIQNDVDIQRSFRQRYGMAIDKRSGRHLRFAAAIEAGLKKNYYRSREDESVWQGLYSFEGSSSIETLRGQSIYLRAVSAGIFSDGDIHPAELYPVGGARSIRGYRENQFRVERFAYLNLEYRLGSISRVFLFSDTGAVYRGDSGWKLKSGAGFGLRSVSAVGIIELSFGVAEQLSLDAARIHVSLVESF